MTVTISVTFSLLFVSLCVLLNNCFIFAQNVSAPVVPTLTFTQYTTNFITFDTCSVVNVNDQYQIYFLDWNSHNLLEIYTPQDNLDDWIQAGGSPDGQSTDVAPNAVTSLNGTQVNLFLNKDLQMYYLVGDGKGNWREFSPFGLDVPVVSQPQAASAPINVYTNRIVVIGRAKGKSDKINLAVIDGGALIYIGNMGDLYEQSGVPCITFFKKSWYVFYRGIKGKDLWVTSSSDGINWSLPKDTTYDSSWGCAATVYKNAIGDQYMYLFFTDAAETNEILYVYTDDGETFQGAGDLSTGMFIDEEPSVTSRLEANKFGTVTKEFIIAGRKADTQQIIFMQAIPDF